MSSRSYFSQVGTRVRSRAYAETCVHPYHELDRSRLYLELLPMVNAGTIEILNDPKLLRELRGLERRRGTAGRDRVDHRPGSHDDRANALAGAAWCVSQQLAGGYSLRALEILNS